MTINCLENLDKCDAKCCKVLGMTIYLPTQEKLRYYELHGCEIKRINREHYLILIPCVCPQLHDNRCILHGEQQPTICKRFGELMTDGYYVPDECIFKR